MLVLFSNTPMDFILYDLEATCWPAETPGITQEIIEIGAFKIDKLGQTKGRFHKLVRPILFPNLSPYCRNLTGIQQEEIDCAPRFPVVIEAFEDWLWESDDYAMISWGASDPVFLEHDFQLHRLESTSFVNKQYNLKQIYKEVFRLPGKLGLNAALRREGLAFEGNQHRALDDARNMASLFLRHIDIWPIP